MVLHLCRCVFQVGEHFLPILVNLGKRFMARRIVFAEPVTTPQEARKELVRLAAEAFAVSAYLL